VREDASSIALTQSEFELLGFFLDNPNVVFSREELLAVSRMRQHAGPGDRSVDALVKRLRRKIEPDPDAPVLIQTVWGRGYRFQPANNDDFPESVKLEA
jgi:DNA-binding response OmpR family regulator